MIKSVLTMENPSLFFKISATTKIIKSNKRTLS